jgi:hypothetical protein
MGSARARSFLSTACCKTAWLVLLGTTCGACGGASDAPEQTRSVAKDTIADSVCPNCPMTTGGESSDFGGTPSACTQFEERAVIERAEAQALGFDVTNLENLVTREIDAPLRWSAATTNTGGPAAGYQAETWIDGNLRLSGKYEYFALDPQRCEGNTCFAATTSEVTCSDRLTLGIEGKVRTRDGAVSASVSGYLLQGRAGFPFGEIPAGTLRADLHDVVGTLEVSPPTDMTIVEALFMIDIYLKETQTEGGLRPHLLLSKSSGTGADYIPLHGEWPDRR